MSKARRLTKRERAELKTATKTISAGMSELAKVAERIPDATTDSD